MPTRIISSMVAWSSQAGPMVAMTLVRLGRSRRTESTGGLSGFPDVISI
jgi:hypothetical protein